LKIHFVFVVIMVIVSRREEKRRRKKNAEENETQTMTKSIERKRKLNIFLRFGARQYWNVNTIVSGRREKMTRV